MIEKVMVERRKGHYYSFSIRIMGQEQVLLTETELLDLYNQISEIIMDDELLVG